MAAGFDEFARRITRRAEGVEKQATKVIREVALVVDSTVVLATPVDTGRARANWLASLSAPILSPDLDAKDPGGNAAIAKAKGVIETFKSGKDVDIIIQNNVPYIETLNAGSSAQAPVGFVQQAVLAGIRAVTGKKIVVD